MEIKQQIILFGDSITYQAGIESEGYQFASHFSNLLNGKYDVVVRGYPGANTNQALDYIKDVIPSPEKEKVQLLTIWFGSNDAGLRNGVPIEEYRNNLKSIIDSTQVRAQMPDVRIVLITPPPIEESLLVEFQKKKYGMDGPPMMTAATTAEYAKVAREVAQEFMALDQNATSKEENIQKLQVLDVWGRFISMTGWREGTLPGTISLGRNKILAEYLVDGLHLTAAAYRIVCSDLFELIKTNWPELAQDLS